MGPRICLSNKFPEAADAAGQDHTLRICDLELFSKKSRERTSGKVFSSTPSSN